jgi:hypothetical protein
MPEFDDPGELNEFEYFDEAQPFLQLLADILNRLVNEQTSPEDDPAQVTEETVG